MLKQVNVETPSLTEIPQQTAQGMVVVLGRMVSVKIPIMPILRLDSPLRRLVLRVAGIML
jgi:hypothetical protein